ncbi:DUF3999 domain-containing protein [Marilutibacter alkalisoli]|uniref:DUF3999 domain-containing protein n=1 Tax=Marilutibacter alkalisoli TaxID=2591633 RepID=A0A514BP92_9GAMM|nr:DUF3999 domain-containing protein [Lysobacter alkalisoli]QDH69207.1 DUF3999 domain-containing protein [Lysobacter alkalisoli]
MNTIASLLVRACLAALLLPSIAMATGPEGYGWEWPLTLSRDDGGAYRATLDESVYRRIQDPRMRDLEVFDGEGLSVPAAVFEPEQPLAQSPRRLALSWFTLPAPAPGAARRWELVSEADEDGRLRRVEVRGGTAPDPAAGTALLVDLSRVREAVVALEFEWNATDALDLGYRVEASDDLDHWQSLAARGRLIDLQREGRRLLHRRIELFGLLPHHQRARYLRLTPDRPDQVVEITALKAIFAPPPAKAALQWVERAPARAASADGRVHEYTLDGRFPIRQVDVALSGNHAVEWRLESRDSTDADWQLRTGPWMTYQVGAGNGGRSAARELPMVLRDRYWRLSANGPVNGEPALRFGYAPEVVVFLAQGAPPYVLAAGSTRARRADSPLPRLVETLRAQQGDDWQPAAAWLGTSRVLAGDAALAPVRDWTSWLLWSLLVLGALVVAGFALSLLRPGRGPSQSPEGTAAAPPETDTVASREGHGDEAGSGPSDNSS